EITHILPSEWHLIADDINLVLLPESGLAFDSLTPTKVLVNGTWDGTWAADIEPGNWILYATYDGDEGQFAAMSYLEAAVAEGGEANATLSPASLLPVTTKWFDYDGVEHTLGDSALIDSGDNLVFSSGNAYSWNETVDANGELSLLLPAGDYSISGTFMTTENDIEMTYNGGKSAEVVGGGVESPEQQVLFSVQQDHSISFTVGENHTSIQQSVEDGDDFTIINNDAEDGNEFTVGEINLDLTYNGNGHQDEYLLTVEMNGGDAAFWTVEVWNGTNETTGEDIWDISRSYTLGLDVGTTADLRLRITAPNESVAESYDEGHSMLIKMTHSDQSTDEYEIKLFVPQQYGVEINDEIPDFIGIQPGHDESFAFMFTNYGNGDDSYSFHISELPEALTPLWSVTGASAIEVGPRSTQGYSVTIHASEVWVGDAEFTVTITVLSEDNTTSEVVTLNIKTAMPNIKMTDWDAIGLAQGGFAALSQNTQLYVNVENTGLVDARDVEVVVLKPVEDAADVIVGSLTLDVPMGETTIFTIDIEPVNEIGSITYTLRINSTADQLENDPEDKKFKINYQPEVSTKANSWLGVVVGIIVAGIIGLFWKFSGRRGQAF
nr:hypothetical protein [Candidatus Poseidoniales archaeon]